MSKDISDWVEINQVAVYNWFGWDVAISWNDLYFCQVDRVMIMANGHGLPVCLIKASDHEIADKSSQTLTNKS